MQTYEDLVELAPICLKQAHDAKNSSVSAEFMHLAKGYQMRAASMVSGKLPDIGEDEASRFAGPWGVPEYGSQGIAVGRDRPF
jgi:hypothetical protein